MEGVTGLWLQSRLEAKYYCHTTFIRLPAHTKPSLNICSVSDTENVAGGYFKEKGGGENPPHHLFVFCLKENTTVEVL